MNRYLPCLALALALIGCGGGGSSTPSPYARTYRQTAREDAYLAGGTVNYTVYVAAATTTTVRRDGRFETVATNVYRGPDDALHTQVDTIVGTVDRKGRISGASRTTTLDGAASPGDAVSGGTGSIDTSMGYTEFYMSFPGAPDNGTYRYDLSPGPEE